MGTPLSAPSHRVASKPLAYPGEVIADAYRVEHILDSRGGTAVVVAERCSDKRPCVLRVVDADRKPNPRDAVERLERAFQVGTIAPHPHLAHAFDLGWADERRRYLAVEYLEGQSLHRWVEDSGVLPVDTAVDLLLQVCEGLAEVHAAGIAHLALRPSCVFVLPGDDGKPSIKILDFGSARMVGLAAQARPPRRRTRPARVKRGAALYVAPEQISAPERADERTDIWALGRILELVLTGRVQGTIHEAAGVPGDLRDSIARCQARHADDRFPDLAALAMALVPFGGPNALKSAVRTARALGRAAKKPKPPQMAGAPLARVWRRAVTTWSGAKGRRALFRSDDAVVPPVERLVDRRTLIAVVLLGAVAVCLAYAFAAHRPSREAPVLAGEKEPAVETGPLRIGNSTVTPAGRVADSGDTAVADAPAPPRPEGPASRPRARTDEDPFSDRK